MKASKTMVRHILYVLLILDKLKSYEIKEELSYIGIDIKENTYLKLKDLKEIYEVAGNSIVTRGVDK